MNVGQNVWPGPQCAGIIIICFLCQQCIFDHNQQATYIEDIKLLYDENLINDLKQKHSININNKLMNTTVIYYPEFTFSVFFDNNSKDHH